ncbi:uncharacterized protein V6R79_013594, partial [Siganus canaliculatus]
PEEESQGLNPWSVRHHRLQRAVNLTQQNQKSQLLRGVQGQFGQELNQNDTRIRDQKESVMVNIQSIQEIGEVTTTVVPWTSTVPKFLNTIVKASLGGVIQLPCRCGRWSVDSKRPLQWKNSRGDEIVLVGPEVDSVSFSQRKYVLYNDLWWLKVKGDCSLVLCNITLEDLGEYTCSYWEPEFEKVPLTNGWKGGFEVRKITLSLETSIQEQPPSVKSLGKESTNTTIKDNMIGLVVTSAPIPRSENIMTTEVTIPTSINTVTPLSKAEVETIGKSLTTSSVSKELGNVTIASATKTDDDLKSDDDRSMLQEQIMLENRYDLDDIDEVPGEMIDHYHALEKREAKWRAYGFDSSKLQIADPWASRNLWFQQLTHSVKSVSNMNCPCV